MLETEDCLCCIVGVVRCIGAIVLLTYILAGIPLSLVRKRTFSAEPPPPSVCTYYVDDPFVSLKKLTLLFFFKILKMQFKVEFNELAKVFIQH